MMRYLLLLLFVSSPVSVNHLRCEMLTNPEGIDVLTPRLSWEINGAGNNIKQTAYQVIVASSIEKLNEGDLWNSGKVSSDQSIHITYAGKPLKSGTDCYWKVKVWTTAGVSDWSTPTHWSMGLFNWQAHWIGLDSAFAWDSAQSKFSRLSARYCRKSFDVKSDIKKATVYMAGVGHYELYINGKQQRNVVLAQAPTDYSKNILYNTYDVTNIIKRGENVIGTILGNGRFFTMRQAYKPYKIKTFGYPKLLLQLNIEYTNGEKKSIVTDDSWKITADGPIRTNNEYDGEEYDATKEMPGWDNIAFNDEHWLKAALVQAPGGRLEAQMNEPVKVMEKIKAVSIRAVTPGVYIMDMGQNMVGWLRMKVTGQRGQQVTLRYAETLQSNGTLYTDNLRDAKVTDRYTLKGGGKEIWAPSFVYHGFRYVEITGCTPALDDFVGEVVYDNLTTTGQFETSDPTLNQIYKNAYWGIRGNYKGMPIDCPQRNERMPWLGDRATGAYGESFLFDNVKLYAKWLDDIEYAQTAEGAIPDVAPAYWNYYSDNMTWPGSYLLIANTLYEQFGDVESIRKHYPSMKKWMEYMRGKYLVNNIMTKDKYGDWCVPPESKELIHAKDSSRITSGTLIATAYYYHLLTLMQHFAGLVHEDKDAKTFADLSVKVKTAFNQRFLNNKHYDNNTVTANLLPLSFDMVPAADRKEIFEQIVRKSEGNISTGMIGTQWLMRGLTGNGRPDLAYEIAASRDYPGWGYMVANGATTIWELWNGNTANPSMNSHNHVMLLGDLLVWYYENLAGIKSHDAFKDIIMKPVLLNGLDEVNASFHCMYGDIRSHWKKTPGSFTWDISIPANTTATIYIPAKSVKDVKGHGTFLRMEQERAVYKVGSGNYRFISEQAKKKAVITDEFVFDKAPFPESHAATIAETPKGLITAWFGGTKERNPDVGIWVSRQVNNTWTMPVEVANGIVSDSVRYACWNPVLYQVPGGDLLLFYKTGPNVAGWKGWMKTSADGGISWSAPQALPQGFLGPVKNKPVLLDSTLLCPSSTEGGGWKVHFEATKDNGKTWSMTGPINDGKTSNAIQPSILSYGNGKLQILCRSKERVIEQSWSTDNGRTWSPITATSLPNNNSGTDAVTLSDGRQLLVYNHVKTPEGASKGARTPLNIAISKDGITWYAALVLEDSPIGQYSYPSVIQSADGYVHIVYTWRRQKIKYVKIDPRQLTLKLIKNEQWTDVNL
ncbi:alpha-L-rhamnosidase [Chitinophaga sp. YR573]|uniref:family 78 glycoside hydrolase catalytic domain n=1 Tax=Chitinophaga sp. YR573 TaxID=1881040 RepID=UPI0008CE8B80|nr:family 78 glycoside hydrolase catalytic domain [Chitinophaga sp. YR573]SEW22306.1 alpha-L-rhamnosidase [Chitinophaga sp. YR573]